METYLGKINKTTKLNNDYEKTRFNILEYYQDIINSYNNGVSINSIENMIDEDFKAFKRNKQSRIQSEKDYNYVMTALLFFKAKIEFIEDHEKVKDTYFDKCIDQKNEFENILDSGVSIDNLQALLEYDFYKYNCNTEIALENNNDVYNNPTVTKSDKDKTIKKLAFNLLKKENN